MTIVRVNYKDWIFEVNKQLTEDTYAKIMCSGSEGCDCDDCKNYLAFRDSVFPAEVHNLFNDLGIDYRKEVEILSYETLPNGLHCVGGWFHFKGRIVSGKDCRVPLLGGGNTLNLTKISDNFEIGFAEYSGLTYFENKDDLVQIEFITYIPSFQ